MIDKLEFVLKVVLVVIAMLCRGESFGQERCGTVTVLENKRNRLDVRESDEQFEQWLSQRAELRKEHGQRTGAYTVPVVFHVIHKGEQPGTGVNVSDAQLLSQIAVLNRDFNRTNPDAASTPAEFAGVAGAINISFVLAKQDPEGNSTSGIVRVRGTKNQWSVNDETTLKALSYWPAEDYLNIWVTDLSSSLLGYAQFPVSNLAGLEDAEDNRTTDGVVVDYSVVGSSEDGNFNLSTTFNKGRSATHEVGHYFGLRHIWGDDSGSCSGSGDYVDDTPNQANNTDGCPTHPQTSCSAHTMFQNYMDYTNDVCMNLFTQGQVARMITVIENSPRRASLLTSSGAEDPAPVANDITLVSFASPTSILCGTTSRPMLRVVNNGTEPVTQLSIAFFAGSDTLLSSVILSKSLASGAATTVSLDAFEFQPGNIDFGAKVVTVNGVIDSKLSGNSLTGTTYLYFTASVPYVEPFETTPQQWRFSDTTPSWRTKDVNGNRSLFLNSYGTAGTDSDVAITPGFTLPTGKGYLIFDLAYASVSSSDDSQLAIYALNACSDDVSDGTLLFSKSGNALSTSGLTSTAFVPTNLSWRQEVVDLSVVAKGTYVRFAIVVWGTTGNDLYVDNFHVVGEVREDVELADVTDFGPVTCQTTTRANLVLRNKGATLLSTIQVSCHVNGELISIETFSNLSLSTGSTTALSIQNIPTTEASNSITFEVLRPNGLFDTNESNNSFTITTTVNSDADIIPYRQPFENGRETWTALSPYGGEAWAEKVTPLGGIMSFTVQDEVATRSAWLVSPLLDFSDAAEASVFFDVARLAGHIGGLVEFRSDSSDTLRVMISTDCGHQYQERVAIPLALSSTAVDIPAAPSHWIRHFIDLTAFAGMDAVRIAVVLEHPTANIFIDNAEFFLSSNPAPVAAEPPFSVYGTEPSSPGEFYVTFHLDERHDVSYSLLDMTGRVISTKHLTDVLNQTYELKPQVNAGIYLLRVQIGDDLYTSRVYIDQ